MFRRGLCTLTYDILAARTCRSEAGGRQEPAAAAAKAAPKTDIGHGSPCPIIFLPEGIRQLYGNV